MEVSVFLAYHCMNRDVRAHPFCCVMMKLKLLDAGLKGFRFERRKGTTCCSAVVFLPSSGLSRFLAISFRGQLEPGTRDDRRSEFDDCFLQRQLALLVAPLLCSGTKTMRALPEGHPKQHQHQHQQKVATGANASCKVFERSRATL